MRPEAKVRTLPATSIAMGMAANYTAVTTMSAVCEVLVGVADMPAISLELVWGLIVMLVIAAYLGFDYTFFDFVLTI